MENQTITSYSDQLHKVIPGGAHTYSKGDDQYPSNAPQILSKGEGAYVWDADGNKFLDYGMGLRSITVGYAQQEINQAALEGMQLGNNLTRASLIELKAAELMCSLFPSADMVKFAKNGSTTTSAAVKLSRAYTGRKLVVRCAQQPFFSYDDWFIGSTPLTHGIPAETSALTLQFEYNNIDSLKEIFAQHSDQIACVILEPCTTVSPCASACDQPHSAKSCQGCPNIGHNFLHQVKEVCKANGAVFILDEMITGFRWDLRGAQRYFDIEPDLATFGKGMANGFSVAALVGKKEIMELGGIREEGAERVFLVSTTHGAEMSSLAAFIKTIEVYERDNVTSHLWDYGQKFKDGINNIAQSLGIQEHFYVEGYPCSPNYVAKDHNKDMSLAFRTLFSQEMINHGVLIPWVALSYAHQDTELNIMLEAAQKALTTYKQALESGIERYLKGDVIRPVFRKYN